ncbi:thioether cross-link-forming SCIFF peptide maturase [Bacillota bacterium LX-D]|nr:thioether cross-link-forming SCIFF peptide maturase [Bacillota bacterium LX-D]
MIDFDLRNVHRFQQGDLAIVLDVNSGSIHIVDDSTWQVLAALDEAGGSWAQAQEKVQHLIDAQSLAEIKEELENLQAEGLLFTQDDRKEPDCRDPILKSLCLHLAHDCNLRCKYCFATTGDFGGKRELMDFAVGKKALDYLLAHSGKRKLCEVDFFGGEPLMNFTVMKELVAYGKKAAAELGKKFKFTLTTNGVLLNDDVQQFLNQEQISVVLSIDGRREINDRMRPFAGGKGSYERIVPIYQKFAAARNDEDYVVRGTYTRYNLDFSQDVFHLFDLGFTHLSVEPVVAAPEEDYAFHPEDVALIKKEYEKLAEGYLDRYFAGKEMDFFHFNIDLDHGPCLPKRLTGCGAGYEYMAVTPAGEFYPCHQFVGREEYLMGNINDGLTNYALAEKFQRANVYHKETCNGCWARFFCSGGCHANAEAHNGDILKPYELGCELQKKRLECAIYVQVKKRLKVV